MTAEESQGQSIISNELKIKRLNELEHKLLSLFEKCNLLLKSIQREADIGENTLEDIMNSLKIIKDGFYDALEDYLPPLSSHQENEFILKEQQVQILDGLVELLKEAL